MMTMYPGVTPRESIKELRTDMAMYEVKLRLHSLV